MPDGLAEVDVYGALKGGVGKTRAAMLTALYMATVKKENVHLVDGDSVSQTANYWRKDYEQKTGKEFPVTVTRHPFDDLDEYVADLRGKHDRVVCDIGGGNVNTFTAGLVWANRLVVPIGADPSEVRRLSATWKAAKSAAEQSEVGGFDSWVLLSKTDHTSSLPSEYRNILTGRDGVTGEEQEGYPVYPLLETELRKAVAYQRAYANVPTDFLHIPQLLAEIGVIKNGAR